VQRFASRFNVSILHSLAKAFAVGLLALFNPIHLYNIYFLPKDLKGDNLVLAIEDLATCLTVKLLRTALQGGLWKSVGDDTRTQKQTEAHSAQA
jgi:hypothetical protein